MKKLRLLILMIVVFGTALPAFAQDQNIQQSQQAITSQQIADTVKSAPTDDQLTKGDPGGTMVGSSRDIIVSDSKKGLTITDVINQVGQNRIAINLVWTLIAGFLVMFMQAGFALVETGLVRAKNASHTMLMNFAVYGIGMFGYWIAGFALQQGGSGPFSTLGGGQPLNSEFAIHIAGKTFGLFGTKGFFLTGTSYDVSIAVLFLFMMVFMDTTATIPTGAMAERWKFLAFVIYGFFISMFIYPLFGNWAWGGGWLSQLGTNFGLGHGYADFAGSGVVHAVGGITALAGALVLGPRIGKYDKNGKPRAIPAHDIPMAILGTFILAFGWFGFNPGSTLAASGNGALRIGLVATVTMLASATGTLTAMLYMWLRHGKPDPTMIANGMLAGLVAITAPSGFVSPVAGAIIGAVAGVLVCISVEFVDNVLKVDDPVGAISVHGVNGIWGLISLGLFADGTGNYGGAWNGVAGNVTGLFYGDPGQLVAELIGILTVITFVFVSSYIFFKILDAVIGMRVTKEVEIEGLDIPETGVLAYPDFTISRREEQ